MLDVTILVIEHSELLSKKVNLILRSKIEHLIIIPFVIYMKGTRFRALLMQFYISLLGVR